MQIFICYCFSCIFKIYLSLVVMFYASFVFIYIFYLYIVFFSDRWSEFNNYRRKNYVIERGLFYKHRIFFASGFCCSWPNMFEAISPWVRVEKSGITRWNKKVRLTEQFKWYRSDRFEFAQKVVFFNFVEYNMK